MKTKTFRPGDKVKLQTKTKSWEGHALESHDPEIILLKLKSGYNIGIRENEILDAAVLEKAKTPEKKSAEQEVSKKLPNIAIIITGGTISSRLDPKSGGVISTDKEEILNIAPELKEICNITIESPFMKFSEDMDPRDWKKIAEVCEKYLNDKSVDGLILTHGTDTLHYTSAALSFFLKDLNKPLAITYSQRSIDRASTDAALNLICATKYATSDIAEIALVGHENDSDESCLAISGDKTRKMHSSRRDTFKPINTDPIARITKNKLEILKTFNAKDASRKVKLDAKFDNKVTIVKVHPGQDPSILEYYQEQGYKGVILEVSGLGQVPGKESEFNWLPKIKKAISSGMTICATAQTIFGKLNPNVYSSGRDLQKTGIIFLDGMTSEAALVKLGWVLGHKTWDPKEKMLDVFNEFNKK
jgi:glutamyl-tRNA(Gln) amidotransferase subunit D